MVHKMPHCMNILRFSIMLVIGMALAQYVMLGASEMPPLSMMNEAEALMAFKAGISEDPFGRLQLWQVDMPNDSSPCKVGKAAWDGILCDSQMRHVITVNLQSFNLTGSISPSLAFLTALSRLDLSRNLLYGEVPSTLFIAGSPLRYLDLSHNSLEGGLPNSLSNLSALVVLDVSYNNFVAGKTAASTLSQLRNLEVLMLEETPWLTADIANEIWQLPVLSKLWIKGLVNDTTLPDNLGFCGSITQLHLENIYGLYSTIPSSLGQCRKLELLAFIHGNLQGFIPPQIWQLPVLQTLIISSMTTLDRNSLSVRLPEYFAFCHTIIHLELEGFNNTGSSIPSSLGGCHHLEVLVLENMGLQGNIPPQIWQLPSLQILRLGGGGSDDMSDNEGNIVQFKVHGALPSYFSFCPSLIELNIWGINLTGGIPSSLGQCTSLRYLQLENDNLQGSIPESLQNLTNLQELDFSYNNLTGGIPASMFAERSQLQELLLDGNKYLSGSIPRQLGELTQLHTLSLYSTLLSGPVPEELCNCTQLENIYLGGSTPVIKGGIGNIPNCLGRLSQLSSLAWDYSNINGEVPVHVLKNLSQLCYLSMDYARLRGSIPHELGNLSQQLGSLSFVGNELSGIIPIPFIRALSILGNLYLSKNKLSGEIPSELGALEYLLELDLSENKFLNGPLPKSLENCSNLQYLRLFQNNLSGKIEHFDFSKLSLVTFTVQQNNFMGGLPSNFVDLVVFDVSGNNLSGPLDPNVATHIHLAGKVPNLRVLVMSYNNLNGKIPGWLWELPVLQVLDLSNNHFSGIIPTSLSNLTYFKQDQTQNKHQGTLYEETPQTIKFTAQVLPYILNTRVSLDVSMNHLEGEISESFGELLGLTSLNMSHNYIRGTIPASLGKLVHLEVLDISHNNLIGSIPKELGLIGGLSTVDFSYNDLEGEIPTLGHFNTRFDNKSFAHNARLCGPPLATNCSTTERARTSSTNFSLGSVQGAHQSYARQVIDWFGGFTSPWGLLLGYVAAFLVVLYCRHHV